MKTKVCFKALCNHKIVRRIIPIEHNFDVIPACEFKGYTFLETSVESQVIDYLDSIDKSEIMLKYNFDMIFDYYIPKKKKNKSKEIEDFIEYLKPYISVEEHRNLRAVMFEAKDVLFGKGKSNETKAKELFVMLNIANKSILGTFNVIENIIKGDSKLPIKINLGSYIQSYTIRQ